ncbi:MAG TPA: hypothetical protein VNC41_11800, partial [Acidimicrobiia bacterium]|nr:hypothetical protein [Acidimicrobiia bacterium]
TGCVGVTDGPNATVWYAWQAPGDGAVLFSTCSNSSFDSMLAIYDDHPAFGGVRVGESNFGGCGSLQFDAVGGRTYWVQVDGRDDATGHFALTYEWSPGNDDFADASELTGTSGSRSGSMRGATAEANEPFPCDGGTGCTFITDLPDTTVWYRWTAPADGTATFDTCLTFNQYDTVMAVYTGSTLTALDRKGQNDNSCGSRSRVTIPVVGGETYRIQVDGVVNTPVDFGIRWAFTAA